MISSILLQNLTFFGSVLQSVLSSAVDRGFEHRSGQTKNYKIDICCFSGKHSALRKRSKDWLAWNQDNVSEWATSLSVECCFSVLAL